MNVSISKGLSIFLNFSFIFCRWWLDTRIDSIKNILDDEVKYIWRIFENIFYVSYLFCDWWQFCWNHSGSCVNINLLLSSNKVRILRCFILLNGRLYAEIAWIIFQDICERRIYKGYIYIYISRVISLNQVTIQPSIIPQT